MAHSLTSGLITLRLSGGIVLVVLVLGMMEQSDQAETLIPKLLQNRKLWQFLAHVANAGSDINPVLLEEFQKLSADPEVTDFVERLAEGLRAVAEQFLSKADKSKDDADSRKETEGNAP